MNFYTQLEQAIQSSDIILKQTITQTLYNTLKDDTFHAETKTPPVVFTQPSYATCCTIVSAKEVPRLKKISTQNGRKQFLHSIAHIEYAAIDLALDACYRFRDLPRQYYKDWLEVALDEIRHFSLLNNLLKQLDCTYGDLPVHNLLFNAGQKTDTFIERMAVVPRYMEANGLDANPSLIKKLEPFKEDPFIVKIIDVLELILKEEVDHVFKGDKWFKYACKKEDKSTQVYFDIIKKYYPKTFPRMHEVNMTARKQAGFSCEDLAQITHQPCN